MFFTQMKPIAIKSPVIFSQVVRVQCIWLGLLNLSLISVAVERALPLHGTVGAHYRTQIEGKLLEERAGFALQL